MQGLEVPLMVLQTKVFLTVTLRKFSPFVSKRRTFIRRVKQSINDMRSNRRLVQEDTDGNESSSLEVSLTDLDGYDPEECDRSEQDLTPQAVMKLFTKIPFPEPRRVIRLRHRYETMDTTS